MAARDTSFRLWRMRGYLAQLTGDYARAVAAYRRTVERFPDDFESWNNLGNAGAALGDGDTSLAALERAAALRPDIAPLGLNLATTLIALGRLDAAIDRLVALTERFPSDPKPLVELAAIYKRQHRTEEAQTAFERAVALDPDNADLRVRLGTELASAWRMEEAEQSFDAALSIDPLHREGFVRQALLLEHTNRFDEYPALIAAAEQRGVDDGAVQFVRALHHRRERRFEAGIAALARAADDIEPARRWQMLGQFNDQLGATEAAFDAFARMNERIVADMPETIDLAAAYRGSVAAERSRATGEWYRGWRHDAGAAPGRSPAFLVGFPRSGTTLLDTMLMGHPGVQVLEERPPLVKAEAALGGFDAIAAAAPADLARARAAYFEEAGRWLDLAPDSLLVDKFPLHMNKVPLIHRLFPEARFVLALRHPCDVVLSCFITSFRPNQAMSNFTDLATVAEVYDLSFGYWAQAREVFAITAHEVMYERMIEDPAAELKPLFAYLGLDWRDEVLDHQQTAIDRGIITTASYAQVIEPLYRRAAGRWARYREQLAPVLPIVAPWAATFGYSM